MYIHMHKSLYVFGWGLPNFGHIPSPRCLIVWRWKTIPCTKSELQDPSNQADFCSLLRAMRSFCQQAWSWLVLSRQLLSARWVGQLGFVPDLRDWFQEIQSPTWMLQPVDSSRFSPQWLQRLWYNSETDKMWLQAALGPGMSMSCQKR